jgi:MFS transporter, LPLT family, lysophospholipid transporter
VNRALPAGILIGALIMAFAHINDLYIAIAMLIVIGACGGFYVVPLNAMLQDRGHATIGSGHAIAVQNFCENICMLLMIGSFTMMNKHGLSVISSTLIIGLIVLTAISLLTYFRIKAK